jgi:arabinogalactan oligomer/maltooligosaccharide transport system permease protein
MRHALPKVAQAFFAVVFAICAIAFSGCGEPVKSVVLWHAYRGGEEKAIEKIAAQYEEENPGVHVELLSIPFDAYSAKLGAAIPRAHGPDLFIDAHERLGLYLRDSLVAPVGDALPDSDLATFDAASVAAVTIDQKHYAVPLSNKCLALYVNDALVKSDPKSIEEISGLRASLPDDSYPLAYQAPNAFFHAPFLHAFGGRMLDEQGHFAFMGEQAAQSVDFVHQLVSSRVVPVEPDGALVTRLFASGHAATAISGPWMQSEIKDGVRYHVISLPKIEAAALSAGRGEMRPLLTVEGVMLTPTGAARDDVRAFARYLGGKESALVRATVGEQVVARSDVWSDPAIANNPNLKAFHDAVRNTVAMPTSPAMRAAWVPANQAILKVLRGDATSIDALNEAADRFADAMRPQPPPPSPAPLVIFFGVVLLGFAFLILQRARSSAFRAAVKKSIPAYKYVAHAVLAIFALVVLPLFAGALTSFFAGTQSHPLYVGFSNYARILTARGGPLLGHGSFYLTLLVTVLWTLANISLHVSIGLVLGVALSRPLLKLRALYRVLLILPWAVPSYVTALAWKGMFHRQFGAINAILISLGAEPVSWFSHFSTAFAANVATNVWLGFPFMMVVTLGALTSIPKDVLEAAEVDGATRLQRFFRVTLPLLKPTLLPAVVLGAVWTFNMFNVVFLVSGGEPDDSTDILVSDAYRWAFTRDAQYGYAAAYAVLIFFLLLGGTRVLGKLSGGGEAGVTS